MVADLPACRALPLSSALRAGTALAAVGVLTLAALPGLAQRTPTARRSGNAAPGQPISGEFKPSQPIAGRNSGFAPTNFTGITTFNAPLPTVPVTTIR
ncbi:hypothetical protein NZK33_19635 [Cyanobium sp. FGCU-6]|nr:hypothetical protein [Cyanobium sp. FGCU6]